MDVERFIFIMKKVMGDDIMLGRKNSSFMFFYVHYGTILYKHSDVVSLFVKQLLLYCGNIVL